MTKRYDTFTAVNALSFAVRPGTIFGLLGPNGAGKTTTIRMIMNIIAPDAGTITILGRPSTEAASRTIGYLPEERGLYKKMKVGEHLQFLGEIRGLSVKESRKRGAAWLERLELSEWRDKKVEELSKGMQQKIQFIGCVIHDPEVIILDEPFSGLDPVNARVLKDLMTEFRANGKSVVFSTHIMEQAEKLCDEIGLINRSRLLLSGTMPEIKKRFAHNTVLLRTDAACETVSGLAGVRRATSRDGVIAAELEPGLRHADFLREATRVCDIDSAFPHEPSLDEIFVEVVSNDAGER
ncbi:MAG: ABC transporter ATP-binding protein [Thermoanaerobaculia bacterium]